MYNYTRQDVADMLWISTRSVDRYIKSGKLRSKKDWKIVYVNDADVENLSWTWSSKQEIIEKTDYEETKKSQDYKVVTPVETKEIEVKSNLKNYALDKVYDDLRAEVKKKDEIIQDLSIKLWRADEIIRNSVSMIDFKRSQMLLEDSKTYMWSEINDLKSKNSSLEEKVKNNNITIIILAVFLIILLSIAWVLWFMNIWK